MKKSTKITIMIVLFFIVQAFITGLCYKLPAEVIKTSEHSFFSTKEQMEYVVWDDCTKACQLGVLRVALDFAKDENAEIHWVEGVPDEVIEGMNKMGNCVVSQTRYKNVEIWNWQKSNGETWSIFIIYDRPTYRRR